MKKAKKVTLVCDFPVYGDETCEVLIAEISKKGKVTKDGQIATKTKTVRTIVPIDYQGINMFKREKDGSFDQEVKRVHKTFLKNNISLTEESINQISSVEYESLESRSREVVDMGMHNYFIMKERVARVKAAGSALLGTIPVAYASCLVYNQIVNHKDAGITNLAIAGGVALIAYGYAIIKNTQANICSREDTNLALRRIK
ncbi:MAG TPA: hypothetical protein PLT65_02420 [Bacilli bacterium]|nr:hypothetical protein [Bacilli bacterium]